ncbi:hypothetical protein O2W15_18900 [Modestobacter sp. VKM Ac-2979]|uniref:hypothetical protein n=1 Tax=unclassified Modestobacter TaxID=2643866 RepID=UPI0022ABBEC6|nr:MULTISPECIES: hypothetical protein [unclassified Modestobacter]MCZ2813500.1 hypothetical protein [Modestobacter sp. VKM Ac-2979]MCZ2842308.1 hypothetical protein [Modestobacter sp. VKM Ac-2980]
MRDVVLYLHVVAGAAGLLLGPAWLLARQRGRSGRGPAVGYQVAVGVVAVTAGLLAVTDPSLVWLLPVAVGTGVLAVTGALARRRRWSGWRSWQPHLLGGSYIALVTGVLIAETGNPVFWLLPALIGQVPIAVAKHRLAGVPAEPLAQGA